MILAAEWVRDEAGEVRPLVAAKVSRPDGHAVDDRFLIDTGADRTVFSASLLKKLGPPDGRPPEGFSLVGVGGGSPVVTVKATLELPTRDGRTAKMHGEYAAFTDASALDLNVLGRDVLNHFDVILSRRRDEIAMLAGGHRYLILDDGRP